MQFFRLRIHRYPRRQTSFKRPYAKATLCACRQQMIHVFTGLPRMLSDVATCRTKVKTATVGRGNNRVALFTRRSFATQSSVRQTKVQLPSCSLWVQKSVRCLMRQKVRAPATQKLSCHVSIETPSVFCPRKNDVSTQKSYKNIFFP